jgi:enoyl-CoA hydratase
MKGRPPETRRAEGRDSRPGAAHDDGAVTLHTEGMVAWVSFDRPAARNAMSKPMYRQFHDICRELSSSESIRAAVFRGAGGQAFIAGSDIAIFSDFSGGADGVAYEAEMEVYTRALADLPFPTIAVIEGWAVGGGLNLAAACDLRIAAPNARMGVPIARSVGNCLSLHNYARLIDGFGSSRAKRMLLLGDFIDAEEAQACGFVTDIVAPADIEEHVERMCRRLLEHAPVTMRVSKQAIARLLHGHTAGEAEDLITEAYGSEDFKTGVAAFQAGGSPEWKGR